MCCDSNLRFPTSVSCFRCTVCVCVNDLKPNQPRPGFEPSPMTLETLATLISEGSDLADYEQLEEHLIQTFSTFESLNESFSNDNETSLSDPGVDLEAVRAFYQRLKDLPYSSTLFLSLIKTSETLLRRPGRPLKHKEDLKFLLIILENPALGVTFFNNSNPPLPPTSSQKSVDPGPEHLCEDRRDSNVQTLPLKDSFGRGRENSASITEAQHLQHSLLKRLFGIISNLPNELHHYLVNWFARLFSPTVFRRRVEMVNSFIAYRLGKHQKRALVGGASGASKMQRQLYANDWQIKASARMMALFFAANTSRPKIELSEFYNTLVHLYL